MSPVNHPQSHNELLPNIIDNLATSHPEKVFCEYPVSPTSYDHGYRSISYRDFANAINGMAHWIVDTLGARGDSEAQGQEKVFQTLVYLGPHDVRYVILLVAAVKAGYKVRRHASNSRKGRRKGVDTNRCFSHRLDLRPSRH
jgi:acyl-CoA synthetase (AMP-forming)/AMP-acid ligase II